MRIPCLQASLFAALADEDDVELPAADEEEEEEEAPAPKKASAKKDKKGKGKADSLFAALAEDGEKHCLDFVPDFYQSRMASIMLQTYAHDLGCMTTTGLRRDAVWMHLKSV